MKVKDLLQRDITVCMCQDNLERAAQLMWDHDLGCLPVLDDDRRLAGMLTDRDVCMAAYTKGVALREIPVDAAMTRRVFSCSSLDDIEVVERVMREHQIRRMPVIDDGGSPIGMVSINDIARAASAGKLPATEVARTFTAITAPRARAIPVA